MFGDDHGCVRLAIWLILVRSVFASSSSPREFTRNEYFVVETTNARVEEDSVADYVRRDGAESSEISGSFNGPESSETSGRVVGSFNDTKTDNASVPARILYAMMEEHVDNVRRDGAESSETSERFDGSFNRTEKKRNNTLIPTRSLFATMEEHVDNARSDGAENSETSKSFNGAESSETSGRVVGSFNDTKRNNASILARILHAMMENHTDNVRRDGAESSETSERFDGSFNRTEKKRNNTLIPTRSLFAMMEEHVDNARSDGAENGENGNFVGSFNDTKKKNNTYVPLGSDIIAVKNRNASVASPLDCVTYSKSHDGSTNGTDRRTSNETVLFEKDPNVRLDFVAVEEAKTVQASLSQVLVPLCCPLGQRVSSNRCVETDVDIFRFPPLYGSNSLELIDESPDRNRLAFFVRNPCEGSERYNLNPDLYPGDAFLFLDNGTIYKQEEMNDYVIEQSNYCFGTVDNISYNVILCFDNEEEFQSKVFIGFPVGLIVSAPCLLATFLVYTLIPELENMHGRTLRAYVASLFIAYVNLAITQITSDQQKISNFFCIAIAFIIHFSFLASFFWLNVMCFDIWWTFGGFRSLQGSVKQRERKKFLIYSIYAWGCASLFTGTCMIMDFVPNIPKDFIRPRFGEDSCWFATNEAKAIYFYGPMSVTVLCNICLFISTALKIVQHKKDTAHHLRGVDSRRHDDNKQWFNLYLKLFIVMGINWSMEIISWLCNNSPAYIWYLTDMTNTLQGAIIFFIFVWKDKIKRLLLKRLGCHQGDMFLRNSTRSGYHSSASRTCITSAAPLQEKINPYASETSHSRPTSSNNDST